MLRPIAISAPHWAIIPVHETHLGSATPFSLLNALRGAFARLDDPNSAWRSSIWADEAARISSISMFDYLPQAQAWLSEALHSKPNIAFIGAMTLSIPGAAECARQIRRALGNECLIVLGGKHATETVWLENGQLQIHPASPLAKQYQGIFDIIVSGDAEDCIAEVGEAVAQVGAVPAAVIEHMQSAPVRVSGDCVVATNHFGQPEIVLQSSARLQPDHFPTVYRYFPLNTKFDVFEAGPTAHGYSYSSKGCIYRCGFCSENAVINGIISKSNLLAAGDRLAAQFEEIRLMATQGGHAECSIFVEDSVFLQGDVTAWERFCEQRTALGNPIEFGVQLTIDLILEKRRRGVLERLRDVGLSYVFLGVETGDDAVAQGMSKNTKRKVSWIARAESAVELLADLRLNCGVSILMGLGEPHQARLDLLHRVNEWQKRFCQPRVVSLNWAVAHPLRSFSSGYQDYSKWGTEPDDARGPLLASMFGEASLNYCLPNTVQPSQHELLEIKAKMQAMWSDHGNDARNK